MVRHSAVHASDRNASSQEQWFEATTRNDSTVRMIDPRDPQRSEVTYEVVQVRDNAYPCAALNPPFADLTCATTVELASSMERGHVRY